ncbi:hypothetical protein C3R29_17700 [Mycobacterium tuberculosis]|nr:hypothetical protein C3R29_17700 [Mycobacterium tuberculosis]
MLSKNWSLRTCRGGSRSTKSLTDFGLGLLLIAVLGTDLGTEQAETNPYNRDAAEQAGRRNRG